MANCNSTDNPAAQPLCKHILYTGLERTRWQRFLNWWRSPIHTPIHTHCAACGVRLSRPTLGPSCCQSCNPDMETRNGIR
jgi:hypothetical protein